MLIKCSKRSSYKEWQQVFVGAHRVLYCLEALRAYYNPPHIWEWLGVNFKSSPAIDNYISCFGWIVCSADSGQPEILLGDFFVPLICKLSKVQGLTQS